ncbi:Inactive serine/threonine-protein kinase ZRK12 [Cardamine amara subsp. amara]|uniref:Inactive serine/threonine-protein kinase ZRK12 n=1 Tax=Cardamine amara subsp. amara TaxID=228776 RepID=A0ABD1BL66_CARAN
MLMQILLHGLNALWAEQLFITRKERSDDSIMETDVQRRHIQNWLLKLMEEGRMDEIADPKMGKISEEELCQMKAFLMLSQRCIGLRGEIPTMVEVAKELKKIQRTLRHESSSPSGETQFDSPQDIASSVFTGLREEVPTMVEELKKIPRSLTHDSSSSSGETQFDVSSSVLLLDQTLSAKALLTSIACQVFYEMFQWVMLNWFRFFGKK